MEREDPVWGCERLDLSEQPQPGQSSVLAGRGDAKGHPASRVTGRNPQEDRLAYLRHTYSTLLIANGENVKVVQELMRHASSRFTLEIYSQAQLIAKRQAQQRLVQALFHEESDRIAPVIEGQLESNYLSHNQ